MAIQTKQGSSINSKKVTEIVLLNVLVLVNKVKMFPIYLFGLVYRTALFLDLFFKTHLFSLRLFSYVRQMRVLLFSSATCSELRF